MLNKLLLLCGKTMVSNHVCVKKLTQENTLCNAYDAERFLTSNNEWGWARNQGYCQSSGKLTFKNQPKSTFSIITSSYFSNQSFVLKVTYIKMIIHTALLYSLLSFIEASGNITYSFIIICDKIKTFNIYPTSFDY